MNLFRLEENINYASHLAICKCFTFITFETYGVVAPINRIIQFCRYQFFRAYNCQASQCTQREMRVTSNFRRIATLHKVVLGIRGLLVDRKHCEARFVQLGT